MNRWSVYESRTVSRMIRDEVLPTASLLCHRPWPLSQRCQSRRTKLSQRLEGSSLIERHDVGPRSTA